MTFQNGSQPAALFADKCSNASAVDSDHGRRPMQHFHVMRWQVISIPSGEEITVADTDYASYANEGEAHRTSSDVISHGDRCTVVVCGQPCCTLHGVRTTLPA